MMDKSFSMRYLILVHQSLLKSSNDSMLLSFCLISSGVISACKTSRRCKTVTFYKVWISISVPKALRSLFKTRSLFHFVFFKNEQQSTGDMPLYSQIIDFRYEFVKLHRFFFGCPLNVFQYRIEMGNHVFVVGNMRKPVKISDRSAIEQSVLSKILMCWKSLFYCATYWSPLSFSRTLPLVVPRTTFVPLPICTHQNVWLDPNTWVDFS